MRSLVGSERELVEQLARYMQLYHQGIVYRFDLAADLKLTVGQAARHKRLHPQRGYPDMWIAEPRGKYHGLYIELKRDGERIYLKNGELSSNAHLQEQAAMLQLLDGKGYRARFAVGYEQATQIIDQYLALPEFGR